MLQGAKRHKGEAHVKALRDLQQSQKVAGYEQEQSIRDDADIRLLLANLLAGMAKMKREYACMQALHSTVTANISNNLIAGALCLHALRII